MIVHIKCFEYFFTVKPLSVAIAGAEHPFLSGEPSSLECVSYGSRPAANITWYHNGRVIEYETKRIKVYRARTVPVVCVYGRRSGVFRVRDGPRESFKQEGKYMFWLYKLKLCRGTFKVIGRLSPPSPPSINTPLSRRTR